MLTKERFKEVLGLVENHSKEEDRWSEFGINPVEMPINDHFWELFTIYIDDNFDINGYDWIYWYLWERISIMTGEVLPYYEENSDEPKYVNNLDDLWELIKNYRK